MHGTIREDLEHEVGHHHGVRDAENVVGVGRAVEGEDADLRWTRRRRTARAFDGVEARGGVPPRAAVASVVASASSSVAPRRSTSIVM